MATITRSTDDRRVSIALAAGETSAAFTLNGADAVITVAPNSGGTMLAQATFSLPDAVTGGTATWFDWDAGTTSTKACQMLTKATAVRFTATTQPGVAEIAR